MRKPLKGEPPAPTPLDEVMSAASLDKAPWVKARIKQLGLQGKFSRGWAPPHVALRLLRLTHRGTCSE